MQYLLTIFIALLITGCGVTTSTTSQDVTAPCSLTFKELETVMNSVTAIHTIAVDNISYVSDPADGSGENRPPQETWALRYGDCEDYAIFCAYFLKRLGYEYQLITILNNFTGHMILAWKIGENEYMYSSNGCISQVIYSSFEEIPKKIAPSAVLVGMYQLEDLI